VPDANANAYSYAYSYANTNAYSAAWGLQRNCGLFCISIDRLCFWILK